MAKIKKKKNVLENFLNAKFHHLNTIYIANFLNGSRRYFVVAIAKFMVILNF